MRAPLCARGQGAAREPVRLVCAGALFVLGQLGNKGGGGGGVETARPFVCGWPGDRLVIG